jgi:2-methylcitrate dehydratase PrpD
MSSEEKLEAVLEWVFSAELPLEVNAKARLLLLDTLGCVLAASTKPRLRAFAARLAASDPGPVRVPGFAEPFSVTSAAVLFCAAACWDEACEGLAPVCARPGVPVIAACCSLAQVRLHSLQEVLDAIATGYETGGRLGEAVRMQPGMHVDATWPGFGVAAAVVRLSGGSAGEALAAVRTAACQMPHSLTLAAKAGAEARNTYLGHSAQLGLLAANAALAGCTAPEGALEEIGAGAIARPGEWFLLEGYLKPYAAVRHVHYGAAAALALRPKLANRLNDITRVELSTYAEALTYCGNRAPKTAIQAQFSLSYGVACALATGELGPASYESAVLENGNILDLERKVVLSEDPNLKTSGRRGATLAVEIDGKKLGQTVDRAAGDPGQPMTREEVLAKFARYTGFALSRAEKILDADGGQRLAEVIPL